MSVPDITTSLVISALFNDNSGANATLTAQTGTSGALINAGNTSASSVTGPKGFSNTAISFDGTNDFGRFANEANITGATPLTLSCWFKAAHTTPTAAEFMLNKLVLSGAFEGYSFFTDGASAGDPYTFGINGNPSGAISVTWPSNLDTNWHHLAVTYDGSKTAAGCKMYKDATLLTATIVTNTLANNSPSNTQNFTVAGLNDGTGTWAGSSAFLNVYTRELALVDISALYGQGLLSLQHVIAGGVTY